MKRFTLFLLAVLAISLFAFAPTYAQGGKHGDRERRPAATNGQSQMVLPNHDEDDVEFEGTIESKHSDYWIIDGKTVYVDGKTEIDEEHGPADVGAYVEVEAKRRGDGAYYAKKIKVKEGHQTPHPTATHHPTETPHPTSTPHPTETPHPTSTPGHGQEVEFRGLIRSQNGDQWRIDDITVTVDGNARIDEEDGPAVVGATVDVEAIHQSDGSLWAKKIEVKESNHDDDNHDVEFKGTIEAKNGSMWTIGGRQVMVDGATEINERKGPADVGAYVEVKARQQNDGNLHARKIKVESHNGGYNDLPKVEWKGDIEAMNGNTWTIAGRQVMVDARTRLITDHGPMEVGAYVKVKARQQNDGSLWAERIETMRRNGSQTEVKFQGRIEAMNANQWRVGGFDVAVDGNTVIDQREGPAQVGAYAEVKAARMNDGSLYAYRIHIENDAPDGFKIEFRGPIEAMSAAMWQVAGFQVVVDEGTRFENLARAALGVTAKVKARRMDDGSLLAIKIEVKGDEMEQRRKVEWKGQLQRFDAHSWTVGGRTVMLNQSTEIIGQPVLGAMVEVHARMQADGSLLAAKLKVEQHQSRVKFKGMVESISPNAWVISGRTVLVDGRTVFDQRHGPLGVGVTVKVKAMRQADGSLLALRIKRED